VANQPVLRDYLRLLRLPNVFTAFADVALGFFITREAFGDWEVFAPLVLASGCLYLAGMTLNDVFDVEIDAVERPERPIPSGRIALGVARRLGWGLLTCGLVAAAVASLFARGGLFPRPIGVAVALAGLVVSYNAFLKRTPLGPIAMGGCRTLNVLLGMSAAPLAAWQPMHLWIAGGLGAYVAGLTWFARDEAIVSRRVQLTLAAVVMCGAILALSQYPAWVEGARSQESGVALLASSEDAMPYGLLPHYAWADPRRWHALWLASAALVGQRLVRAIFAPTPRNVQIAVKSSILSIVVLDAICCLGVRGVEGAVIILLLLAPALLLGRWVYST
jgi:heme O synthase-like polyprenyltransferase